MIANDFRASLDQLFRSGLFDLSIAPGADVYDLDFDFRINGLCTQCEGIDADLHFGVGMCSHITQHALLRNGSRCHTGPVPGLFHGTEPVVEVGVIHLVAGEMQECDIIIVSGIRKGFQCVHIAVGAPYDDIAALVDQVHRRIGGSGDIAVTYVFNILCFDLSTHFFFRLHGAFVHGLGEPAIVDRTDEDVTDLQYRFGTVSRGTIVTAGAAACEQDCHAQH